MELIKFIHQNNISNFNNLKDLLESSPYNLKIKEDIDFSNIFLIHTTDKSDLNYKLVRECNGIILEKDTFKILCYTFDKSYEDLNNLFDYNNIYLEPSIEGTLIRLYSYNDRWIVSTKKCIDAGKSKWLSNKNFYELFMECINLNLIEKLNKNNCYSFVLTHPENRIVVNYQTPLLYHISTRDLTTLNEVIIDINIGCKYLEKTFFNINNIDNFKNILLTDENLDYEGYIFIDKNYNRCKIKKPFFSKVKELWGNTNNRFFRYLELRKDQKLLEDYLIFFNYDKNKFIEYEMIVKELCNDINTFYAEKHIKKNNIKIPYYYAKFIYNLHGNFLKDKITVNFYKIMNELLELKPNKISFMINHKKINQVHMEI